MSEFSDSYHLKSSVTNEGVQILKNARLCGFVFPMVNQWVSLVAEGEELVPNYSLIQANEGVLIHFVSAEDYGWYFSVYEGNKRTCHYECIWEEEIQINDMELKINVVTKLIGHDNSKVQKELEDIFYPKSFEDIFEEDLISSRFAKLLGLSNFEWMSYSYVSDSYRDEGAYTGVIAVDCN